MASTTSLPFYFGEVASVDPLDSFTTEATNNGTFDSAFARCAIRVGGLGSGFMTPKWADAATCCLRIDIHQGGANGFFGEQPLLQWFTNAGTEVLKVTAQFVAGGITTTLRLYTLQSGAMTLVGSTVIPNGRNKYAIRLVGNTASGSAELYISGSQRIAGSGLNHAGFAGAGQMRGNYGYAVGGETFWSQGKVSTDICFNDIKTWIPDTDGAEQDFTGDHTAIDEIVYSDADIITSNTNGHVSTFKQAGLDLGDSAIAGIGVTYRASVGGSGVQNTAAVLRVGSTNYPGTTRAASVGKQAFSHGWDLDPSTSLAFDPTDVEAMEFGVEAIT